MKRLLVITVLVTVISAAIYSQELKFDGYINSGLGFVFNDNKDEDFSLKAFGVDAEQNGYRFRLNGSYTNEAKTAGVKFRFQSQTRLDQVGYLSLPYALGWVSFLDNMFTLNGGIIEDSTWSTGDFWLASDSVSDFAGLGALLKIVPIDDLALGFSAQTNGRAGGSGNNALARRTDVEFRDPVVLWDARYTIHAAYTMKDVFRAGLSYRTEAEKIGTGTSSKMYGEFRFLGVKDLTAVIAASLDNMGEDFDTTGNIILSETFAYKIDSVNLGLNAVQFLYNRKTDYNPGMFFNLWGSYALDNIVPRLDLVYFMGGRSNLATSAMTWHRKGFTNAAVEKADEKDVSVISVRPSVKFNLDSKTHIEIGDMINYDFGNYDGAYKDSGDANKKSRLSNVFYVDAKWSF